MANDAKLGDTQEWARGAQSAVSPAQVFISYASQDKAVADAACLALEQAGMECWIAPRNVVPGESYAGAIVHAIDATRLLVLILSEHGASSKHVLREVERASSKDHPVVAFRIDAAPMPADLEYFLNMSQWLDASCVDMESALPRLVEAVQRVITSPGNAGIAQSPSAVPSQQTPVSKPVNRRPRLVAIALGVLVALGLVYFAVEKHWPSKRGATEQPSVAAESVSSDKSIAVLPFTDMSEKKDQEYFADGMAEEILDVLARIPGLTVIGRTSSFQFKGKYEDMRTIGAKLNAAYVLEGSVRKSGDQVRITAQLINTRTGAREWSETYDRRIGDVLKLQDAIAAVVVRELQLTVAPEILDSHATVKSSEAYDLYLRGRHAYDRIDQEGSEEAVTLFQRALALDPTFADAAAWLSRTYSNLVGMGSLTPVAGFEQARRAATDALKLDPNNTRAHVNMARIHIVHDWDWAGAEQELQKAAALAPGDVDVLSGEAELWACLGRLDDALRQIKAALAQDPLNADLLKDLFEIQMSRDNFREAESAMRRALDIRPTYAYGHYNLGMMLLKRGDGHGALREMQQESIGDGRQQGVALAFYALGRKADADAALALLLKDQANANALDVAQVYAFRGQSDEAMHWLERAYAQKDPWLFQIKGDWLMKELEADPRYKAFLRKMNFPE
jgi:adenylate cyclase